MSSQRTSLCAFTLRGAIVDLDDTLPYQPHHPSTVILVDSAEEITPVVVPAAVLGDKLPLLCAGRPIQVSGNVEVYEDRKHYVATRLRLLAGGN